MPVTFDPQNGEKPFVEQVTKGDVLGNAYIYEYRRDIPEYIREAMNLTEVPKGLWHYDPMGGNYPYTGKVIVPTDIVVFYGNVRLTKDEHYKLIVTYKILTAALSEDNKDIKLTVSDSYTYALDSSHILKDGDKVAKFTSVCAYVTGLGNYQGPIRVACIYQLS